MAEVSRTARVIQNAKVALFFYCINLILQFFSRKIFLDYLGAELLGLNTTALNLLQFLNLAESGIGAAVAFALYKPLNQGHKQEIIDIVSLQGWFYRWVGLFVIAGSLVLMLFFPWIFAKAQVPLIYAYGTFIAFLISALLSYFVNYKIIVLSADQKEYKITIETQSIKAIKVLTQMVLIWKLPYGYVWWMALEVLASIITSIRLDLCVKKEYPWLSTNILVGGGLRKRYSFLITKIKQLFFHRMGSFVLTQSTPLVIYFFTTLSIVAVYGNYLLLINGCLALTEAVFRGFYASVGSLIAEGNMLKIKSVFWKLVTIKLYIASVICSGFLFLSDSFISLWIGSEYVLQGTSLYLLTAICFIQMTRTSEIFLSAYGLFKDIWSPLVESVLNLGLSIMLGYYWGLAGILAGVLISQVVIINSWKVYFLFIEGFKEKSISGYAISYTKKIFLILISVFISYFFSKQTGLLEIESIAKWLFSAVCVTSVVSLISGFTLIAFDNTFRSMIWKMLGSK